MKELKPRMVIENDGSEPVPAEILQRHIVAVSDQFQKALAAGLKAETIVILLHEKTKVSKPAIRDILYWAPKLADEYTTRGKNEKN